MWLLKKIGNCHLFLVIKIKHTNEGAVCLIISMLTGLRSRIGKLMFFLPPRGIIKIQPKETHWPLLPDDRIISLSEDFLSSFPFFFFALRNGFPPCLKTIVHALSLWTVCIN
jgi:hypothetical protein